jgi:Transglycosylase SLT domain
MTAHANTLSCQWGTQFSSPVLLIQPSFSASNNRRTIFWSTFFDSLKTRSYFKQAALTLGLMAIPVSQTAISINAIYPNIALSNTWDNAIDLIPNYVQSLSLNNFENNKYSKDNIYSKNNTSLTSLLNTSTLNTASGVLSTPTTINLAIDKKPITQKNSIQDLQSQGLQGLKLKLSKENLRLVQFFAKKYYVSPLNIEQYIHYAEQVAQARQLDSSLILAVMSIESNMNPFAQSSMGAQGLMQVMTSVHRDKYALLGGVQRAFDPQANITVGGMILAKYIKMGGSIKSGLKYYVGATGPNDGGYAAKVLAEKNRIEKARLGTFDFTANKLPLNDSTLNTNIVNATLTKKKTLLNSINPININYLATPTISPLNRSVIPAVESAVAVLPSTININNTNTNVNTTINTNINNLQSSQVEINQDNNININSTATIDIAPSVKNE